MRRVTHLTYIVQRRVHRKYEESYDGRDCNKGAEREEECLDKSFRDTLRPSLLGRGRGQRVVVRGSG